MKNAAIKICGMREGDNIRQVEALHPDLIGMICWSKSPRYARHTPDYLPQSCRRTGVFVNPSLEDIFRETERLGLDTIQLHGTETPAFCHEVKIDLQDICPNIKLIKAFPIGTEMTMPSTSEYETVCDYFLFDTSCPGKGGSGRSFNWSVLSDYHGHTPFWLSGGIGPEMITELAAFSHPSCVGIDVNSRFESEPGIKDIQLLHAFISTLRKKGILHSPFTDQVQ